MESKHVPVRLLYTVVLVVSLWCCGATNQVLLDVSPGTGVFEGGFFVLKCVPEEQAADWRVHRNTVKRPKPQMCHHDWGKQLTNSCKVGLAVAWDTGLYWCQSPEGAISNIVNVRVVVGALLVVLPTRPVYVGEVVTLSCLDRDGSNVTAHFYRDGRQLTSDPRRRLELGAVSWAERGEYKCGSGGEQSEPALLQIHNRSVPQSESVSPPTNSAAPPDSAHGQLLLRLLCHLLVFCPYCVSTVLMVCLCRRTPRGKLRNQNQV